MHAPRRSFLVFAVGLALLSQGVPWPAAEADARGVRAARAPRARKVTTHRPGAPEKAPKVVGHTANPIEHLPREGRGIVYGVMGGAGADTPPDVARKMERMGKEIGKRKGVVLTGASRGLPDHAVRGANKVGGLTVGISGWSKITDHKKAGAPTNFDVLQMTKLPAALRGQSRPNYMGREIDNIARSDVIIIAGGRFGTLGELAIALEERKPIGVLVGTGGVADVTRQVIEASARAGKAPGAPVIYDRDPVRLIRRLEKAKIQHDKKGIQGPFSDG